MKRIIAAIALAFASQSHAATVVTVNWSAAFDNGFALQNGTALAIGNEVRLGAFDITDSQVLQMLNAGGIAELGTHFTTFGTAFIGTDAFPNNLGTIALNQRGGLFEKSTVIDLPLALATKSIYMWVFKTAGDTAVLGDFSNVTQTGVFSNGVSEWVFPADSGLPESRTIDLTNLTNDGGTALSGTQNILFGSFGAGITPATSSPAFNLAPVVPEPSSVILALGATVALVSRRRRRTA